MKRKQLMQVKELSEIISDKKGFNILALDVRGVSSMVDVVIIAEANIERHNQSIAKATLKGFKEKPFYSDGLEQGDWIVLDYIDIIVHLFIPALREKYHLENLWPEAKIIDLEFNKFEGERLGT